MRWYYIVSGIFFIIPIIDFAFAAPVLVQETHQGGVDVVYIPEDAMTMLGKRGEEFDKSAVTLFGVLEDHSAKPEEPADGWTDLKQPLPSIPEEPSPESSPDHASPGPSDRLNELWLDLFGHPESHFLPSSSSRPSGPADGWTDVKQPLPSIPEEPSPESGPDHASPGPSDGLNELWLDLFGHPESHFLPSSSSRPSGPAGEWTDVKQPTLSIPKEPSPESSLDYAPPSPGSLTESGYELMKGDTPPGPSGPASSTISSADQELMGAHALPNPGLPTESDREMMNVPPSSPVSSTDPEDEDSPSGKRRKTEKGWLLMLT
jgi:hypothetical protein